MKHWLIYDNDGLILGAERHPDGWPAGVDPNDAGTSNAAAMNSRTRLDASEPQHLPTMAGWVLYECPCVSDSNPGNCLCVEARIADSYRAGDNVLTKPTIDLVVDGVVTPPTTLSTPVDKVPGAAVTLKLVVDTGAVDDGHQVVLRRAGTPHLSQADVILTFTGGETNQVNLVAPGQGMIGCLRGISSRVASKHLHIRGWAS